MDFKVSCAVLLILAFANATPPDQFVKKYISLDSMTPQAIIHLPPISHGLDDTPRYCDFWISFFSDLTNDSLPHHKAFGISIVPTHLDLAYGDSIDFIGHPMYHEGTDEHGNGDEDHGDKATWNYSTDLATENLEFKPKLKWQDVCIKMNGNWHANRSNATLVATLFVDRAEAGYPAGECPNGMTICGCAQEQNCCIYSDLLCNGVSNCGSVCRNDESACNVGSRSDEFVKKYISLDAMTPQAILHLPPISHGLDDTTKLCDFWVSFFSDLPQAALPHHKEFGISIVPSYLELADGDSIEFTAHPMYYEVGSHNHGEKASWDLTKSLSNKNLEFKPSLGWQDVCINMTGNWSEKKSKATLVIILYFDRHEAGYVSGECPSGMTACGCPQEQNRCIYSDLLCNGVANCGAVCGHDENSCSIRGSEATNNGSEWSSFEYMMMTCITGLLLILIAGIFLLTMVYHRRTMAWTRGSFEGNNRTQYTHGINPKC